MGWIYAWVEAVWWAEIGSTANSQESKKCTFITAAAEAGPRQDHTPRLSAFTHIWPGGTAEMSAGSRVRAEDRGGVLTLSEGPKGAQCAFTEGLPGEGTTVEDR